MTFCNENIGLTAVHHVFHTEHNLRVGEIKDLIVAEGREADWQISPGVWSGERLFQAARFITEMENQHLVFEEFARKVQPQVNIFAGYHSEIDPAIVAEFAHTVYRFGHSMLRETVARTRTDGTNNDIGLIEAFLNPLEYDDNGAIPSSVAAGQIVRGMTRQRGNEIDEFVTGALRKTTSSASRSTSPPSTWLAGATPACRASTPRDGRSSPRPATPPCGRMTAGATSSSASGIPSRS